MTYKYQFIILGNYNIFRDKIIDTFYRRFKDLAISANSIILIQEKNIAEYDSRNPSICVYLSNGGDFPNTKMLKRLIKDAVFIIPVVSEIEKYRSLTPKELELINGTELNRDQQVEGIVNRALEGLSLLRESRRIFISYRRSESASVAIQIYELLDQNGFDVFLDTHSLLAGDQFQDELWHRMVDTDIVVLLDTPGFLESRWTEEELAKASAMSIGILQVIWPGHKQSPYSTLCTPFLLIKEDFENNDSNSLSAKFTNKTLDRIINIVESLRAGSLASRQDNLIQEFTSTASANGISTQLQPEKFLTLTMNDREIAVIPTVGVPQSLTFNKIEELALKVRKKELSIYLLYDHRNIVEKWERHLAWLNLHLPVKGRKITEIESWIQNL